MLSVLCLWWLQYVVCSLCLVLVVVLLVVDLFVLLIITILPRARHSRLCFLPILVVTRLTEKIDCENHLTVSILRW